MKLRFFGNIVRNSPRLVLVTIVLITILFSVTLNSVETEFDIEHFLPDIEENKAEKYISKFYESSHANSLYIILEGDVLNKSVMMRVHEIEKRVSNNGKIVDKVTYVELLVRSQLLLYLLENISKYGNEFLNTTIDISPYIKLLKRVENITSSFNETIGSEVEFCSRNIMLTFSELHNISSVEGLNNNSISLPINISISHEDMHERAQLSFYLYNVILWYEIALNSAEQVIQILAPNYTREIEYWKNIYSYVEIGDNESARKMLNEKKNVTSENLTILELGWKFIFKPYDTTLKLLHENLSANIVHPTHINYTLQNTTRNIEALREISNYTNWNLSETIRMLEKYKENLTTLWNELNSTSPEKYLIETVEFQTKYLLENYTGQIRNSIESMKNEIGFLDAMLSALDESPKNYTLANISLKIDELQLKRAEFIQLCEKIKNFRAILESKLITYLKLSLKSYYEVIYGNFSDENKERIDSMIRNFIEFILKARDLNMSDIPSYEIGIDIEFFSNYNVTQIINALNVEKAIRSLENINKSLYYDLLNRTSQKLDELLKDISKLWKILKNITYVLYSSNLESPYRIYEVLRIGCEENISYLYLVKHYIPTVYNYVWSIDDLVNGVKDMLSDDFDYKSASASLIIFHISWSLLNNSDDMMIRTQKNIVRETKNLTKDYKIKVYAISTVLITDELRPLIDEVLNKILPLAVIMIFVTMTLLFRSMFDSLVVLVGVLMAIIWMSGSAALLGIKIDQLTIVALSIVVGLGVDFGIHTIMRYREFLKEGNSVRISAAKSSETVSFPLLLSAMSTGIAFLSNLSAPLPPIQSFGIMCSLGVLYSFIIMSLFVPSIKILTDEKKEKKGIKIADEIFFSRVSEKPYHVINRTCKNRGLYILVIVAILALLGGYFSYKIPVTFKLEDFLPDNSNTSITMDILEKKFKASTYSAKVLYIGEIDNKTLEEIDKFMQELKNDRYVIYTQSESITTYIKEAMLQNKEFRSICEDSNGDLLPDKNVSLALLWLYEYDRPNASKFYTINLNSTVIYIKSSARDTSEMRELYRELKEDVRVISKGKIIITGVPVLTTIIFEKLQESMINSTILTLFISTIILIIAFYMISRTPILGIINIIPTLVIISWIYLTMFLLKISFNGVTATILALTVGMGIPYVIHISHRYLEEYLSGKDYSTASFNSIRNTGSALLNAALTTIIGFGVLVLSSIPPLREFGILSSTTILYSLISSIILLPTILMIWAKIKIRRI